MSATYTDDFDIGFDGPPGESQADILRRTGQYGVLPGDTDVQAIDKLNAVVLGYRDQAEAFALLLSTGLAGYKSDSLEDGQADPNIEVGARFLVIEPDTGRIYWAKKGASTSTLTAEFFTRGGFVKATRAEMAALAADSRIVYLTEPGREGTFVFRSGRHVDRLAADPLQGLYVKADGVPAEDGAWERVWDGTNGKPEWFGAVKGAVTGSQLATNVAAIHACHVLCPVMILELAEYYVNDTVRIDRSSRSVRGTHPFLRSVFVQTNPTKDVCHIGGYAENDRRDGLQAYNIGARWLVDPTPPSAGFEEEAVVGFRIQHLLAGDVQGTFVDNAIVGYYVYGTIFCRLHDYSASRSRAFGGSNDFFKGVWLQGSPVMADYVGGNASIYLSGKSNVTCSSNTLPLVRPTGIYMNGDIADIYVDDLETSLVNFPIDIDCTGATNYCGDVQIHFKALDNFRGDGITIKNLPGTAMISLRGGFMHINDSGGGNKCLWLEGGNGRISVSNMQLHGETAGATSVGVYAKNQPNLIVDDTVMVANMARGAILDGCIRPRFKGSIDAVDNNSGGTRAAMSVSGCSNGNISPKVSGPPGGFSEGILMDAFNTRLMVDMTEIAADSIAGGDKVRIGGKVISAPGFYTGAGVAGSHSDMGVELRGFGA